MTILEYLNAPFRYQEYGVNYEGQVYVSQQSIVDRLNEVLGIANWELIPKEINTDMDLFSVSVLGIMKVYDPEQDRWITRTQFGDATMKIKRGENFPSAQAIEDAKKSAMSDALKKCASWFGVASDVYKGLIKCVPKNKINGDINPIWNRIIKSYGLDPYKYDNGIVILPDSYKEYYVEKKWYGIFESDMAAISNGHSPKNTEPSKAQGKSNSPVRYRIKALSNPRLNQDRTAIFDALTEQNQQIVVIVPQRLAEQSLKVVQKNAVIITHGWFNNNVLKLANKASIEVEQQSNAS